MSEKKDTSLNDRRLLLQVFEENLSLIQKWALKATGRSDWADDVVSRVGLELTKGLSRRAPSIDDPLRYLRGVVRLTAKGIIRDEVARRKRRAEHAQASSVDDSEQTPLELASDAEESRQIGRIIDGLPAEDQQLLLAFIASGSMRHAAEEIGVPKSTFCRRLHKIIAHIASELRTQANR